ncbi:MAG: hypothetical protein IJ743_04340 [Bacilli bacterium]|nr:hypothetical protein [Bacilli bacterium]MBR1749008.1 hypothetical protein [Bacilli bacterium]
MIELIILLVIAIFGLSYWFNNGENVYRFFINQVSGAYDKYAPYSFKEVRKKTKELGQEYTVKQYIAQVILFAVVAGGITYLYFYNLLISLIYAAIAVAFIPYLAYLRCQKVYSEFIFEQIQTYTTNVIMEFNTTQSFVKSLEGVRDSGIIEDPILTDISTMIDMSYQNGTIDESIEFFNRKYPFYMVKNMHQLFLQITKEGAKDSGQALENMSMDIDALVEGVYRDQIDRNEFHKRFLTFGMALFLLVMVMQFLLGTDSYIELLEMWYVQLILHAIIVFNAFFLIGGEKFYYEDVGVE